MSHFKKMVRSAWEAAWNNGDPDALDAIVHADYALENSGLSSTSGLADLKGQIRDMRVAFPDLKTTVDMIVVDEDDFAIFWSVTGTFMNAFGDVPPTKRSLEARGAIQGMLRDGLIIRERVTWDPTVEMLSDLGAPGLSSAFEAADSEVGDLDAKQGPTIEELKDFNRKFVTGVTVVTTIDSDGRPRGLAVSAYMPISLDPPLVVVCIQKTSSTYASLFEAGHLGINILANTQRAVVDQFSSRAEDKFADLDWHPAPAGSPLISGSSASIEAEIKERFRAKTHVLIVARVRYLEVASLDPLVYKAGKFFDGASLEEM
jgi:flavin reductase (DIM6/NTAB) family NADH-FMN oxidoreductase RutF